MKKSKSIVCLMRFDPGVFARAALGALLAATLSFAAPARAADPAPDKSDIAHAQKAIAAAKNNKWTVYSEHLKRIKHPLLGKILRWHRAVSSGSNASFAEINNVMAATQNWPRQGLLLRRAEEAMPTGLPEEETLRWFDGRGPLTSEGASRMASALLKLNRKPEAVEIIRNAWLHAKFGAKQDRLFYNRFRRYLTREDNIERLDRLVWNGRTYAARRMYRRVGRDVVALAHARLALRANRGGVDRAISGVPEALKNDPGLLFERVRWRRLKGRNEEARALLAPMPDNLVHPRRWWREQEILVRRALRDGHISAAYKIVSHHGQAEGPEFAEAEWLAGWIALRFLQDSKAALNHFTKLYDVAKYPISRARGAYWSGRAAAAMKKPKIAHHWYQAAIEYPTTYYGQLALEKIAGENDFSLPPLPHTDKVVVHGFAHHELARAVRALHAAELPALMRPLIRQLSQLGSTPGWMAETARLAADVGRPDLAVLVAKSALAQGIGLVATGYPVLPRSHIQVSLESPFIHAVIRQESAFYQEAVSHAGAQGLMQLMPRTARRVAKMNSIPYRLGRLTEDAAYNMRLGQTFLRELLNEFDGSYVLALAAYNAGPGRARSWMKRNGDPRDPAVDAIDWVELIPFSETRNYVQRVLENFHVYREILNDTEVAIGPESLLRK